MNKTIAFNEFRQNVEKVFDKIVKEKAAYVLTRENRPTIVMMPYDEYLKLCSREEIVAHFNKIWAEIGEKNAHFTEEEVEADIE